jgi:multiple sugar transport system substrate-binding protein
MCIPVRTACPHSCLQLRRDQPHNNRKEQGMNRSMYSHWWRIVALLTLGALILAACGQSGGQSSANASAESGANASAAGDAGASAPAGSAVAGDNGSAPNTQVSGTINFWHFWGSPVRRNAINRVIAVCQQQLPNIQVQQTFKPFGDIWTANIAAVAAGSGMPDVIVEDRPQLKQRARPDRNQPAGICRARRDR